LRVGHGTPSKKHDDGTDDTDGGIEQQLWEFSQALLVFPR
jgi:hypothetical protein